MMSCGDWQFLYYFLESRRFTEEVVLSVLKDHQPFLAEAERNYSKHQTRHKLEQVFEQMYTVCFKRKGQYFGGDSFVHC